MFAAALACALAAAVPAAAEQPVTPTVAHVTETTTGGPDHLAALPSLQFTTTRPSGIRLIQVDSGTTFQSVGGFGAALTDSAAWLIHDRLSAIRRRRLLAALFGAEGIDLQFMRVPMGASDFTADGRPYSYDDLPRGKTDPSLRHFSIEHDRAYEIPTLRGALSVDPHIEILATPWSPPPWMKSNHAFNDIAGLGTLLPSAYKPLAKYFVKFIRAYAGAGIRIAAVTPQNEPQGQSLFPGMHMPWRTEAMWILHYLAPALRGAGLNTEIYAADVGWSAPAFQGALMRTSAAREISGVTWHCYGGSAAVMEHLHRMTPGLDQVVSECATQITPYTVPELVTRSLRNGASTVALWNLALNPKGGPVQPPNSGCHGCRGLVTIDQRTHTVRYSLAYYQLGQFSRFVAQGAVVVSSTQIPGIDDVAVRNPDGSITLVAYNRSRSDVSFALAWGGQYLSYVLPSRATVTFVWNGS